MPSFGYEKVQKKLYDPGLRRHVDEVLPYRVVRGAWKGTLDEDNKVVGGGLVEEGKQLKILFLRVWSEYTGTTVFKFVQLTSPDFPGAAPEGVFDYPMLEAAGAEVVGPVPLNSPIHVVEGSWQIIIQDPTSAEAGASKFGVVWWGVEDTGEPEA